MWRSDLPVFRNPMELVTIQGQANGGTKPGALPWRIPKLLGEPFAQSRLSLCPSGCGSASVGFEVDVDWLNADSFSVASCEIAW
jgi:hypothetical protein